MLLATTIYSTIVVEQILSQGVFKYQYGMSYQCLVEVI